MRKPLLSVVRPVLLLGAGLPAAAADEAAPAVEYTADGTQHVADSIEKCRDLDGCP